MIYLASKSPRRRELLQQMGVDFDCFAIEIDETPKNKETPLRYVERMSLQKAEQGWCSANRVISQPVLAADTSVVLNEQILGKPIDHMNAVKMLAMLSGKIHQVITSVTIKREQQTETMTSITEVAFGTLSVRQIESYVDSGDCFDKAGAYGIQGYAGQFISSIKGSYSGVVGLPLFETGQLLRNFSKDSKVKESK